MQVGRRRHENAVGYKKLKGEHTKTSAHSSFQTWSLGPESWLSSEELFLILQRTLVCFPAPS